MSFRSLAVLLLVLLATQASAAAVPLFDGTTLTGWEGDTKTTWRVRDGVIVGGSFEGVPRNEFLATTATYRDFVLRLEYRLEGREGFVNGGVQIRSVRIADPANEMSGYQADIGKDWSGCIYDESRRNKVMAPADQKLVARIEKPGDWNQYEIRCEGRRIRLSINGTQTVDYTEADEAITQNGLIALQIHGGAKAEISFRAITIEVLDAPAAK